MAKSSRPPIARYVDLRDFQFMPLYIVMLDGSETWAKAGKVPYASRACINLWTRAWHQVPAGSLPDDDATLEAWAGVPNWPEVRDIALRGFKAFSDGRLYHRVIVAEAKKAWSKRRGMLSAVACKREYNRLRQKRIRQQKQGKTDVNQRSRHADVTRDVVTTSEQHNADVVALKGHREEEDSTAIASATSRESKTSNLLIAVVGRKSVDNGDGPKKRTYPKTLKPPTARKKTETPVDTGDNPKNHKPAKPLTPHTGRKESKTPALDSGNNSGNKQDSGRFTDQWNDPEHRDSYALNKLVPFIEARSDDERWQIAMIAEDPDHPNHPRAVTKCLAAAKRAKVGWVSPARRKHKPQGGT